MPCSKKIYATFLIIFFFPTSFAKAQEQRAPDLHEGEVHATLIDAEIVDPRNYPAVVLLEMYGAMCTATIVGPRTILSAGHCAAQGGSGTFRVKGRSYKAQFKVPASYNFERSYPNDADVALGYVATDILEVKPYSVTSRLPLVQTSVTLFGYGCAVANGFADGRLRRGPSEVARVSNRSFVLQKAGNSAKGCPGDSGGPSFAVVSGQIRQMGVHARANSFDRTIDTRLDTPEIQEFFSAYTKQQRTRICGFNTVCN
ncbi:MAG: trypsin-like serine protease [Bdellovibrionota bacterium]